MKKRAYQAVNLDDLDFARLFELVFGRKIVIGIDVAKEIQFAALMTEGGEVVLTIRWRHPQSSRKFISLLTELPVSSVEVAMEPTGTYGDGLRYQMLSAGLKVFRVSAKRVHDAREVYDGVASSHDAKAAAIIAKLHLDRASEPWPMAEEDLRTLNAAICTMDRHDSLHQRELGVLESQLARYWPEVLNLMDLDSVTLLTVLSCYGSPAEIYRRASEARRLMRKTSRAKLSQEKIEQIVESCSDSMGVPMIEGERQMLRSLAQDLLDVRQRLREAIKKVEQRAQTFPFIAPIAEVVGKVTAAVIVCKLGLPSSFKSAHAYEKCAGLNLREKSSGKHKGLLKITKRGSGVGRKYLFLAALRLLQNDPVVKAWYEKKLTRDGGRSKMKAVVAVMRKLIRALYHVSQGERFDSTKLFDVRRLELASQP